MTNRDGPLWMAMKAAVEILEVNRDGQMSGKAYNADVSAANRMAEQIVEMCATVADKYAEVWSGGELAREEKTIRAAAGKEIAREIRALLKTGAG